MGHEQVVAVLADPLLLRAIRDVFKRPRCLEEQRTHEREVKRFRRRANLLEVATLVVDDRSIRREEPHTHDGERRQ